MTICNLHSTTRPSPRAPGQSNTYLFPVPAVSKLSVAPFTSVLSVAVTLKCTKGKHLKF